MSDLNPLDPVSESKLRSDAERTKQVTVFGWTFGVCALFAGITLVNAPTWPVAFAVAAISFVGACVFSIIFKRG